MNTFNYTEIIALNDQLVLKNCAFTKAMKMGKKHHELKEIYNEIKEIYAEIDALKQGFKNRVY